MKVPSERFTIFLVAAVQFVNILDFMMVMPLGPDFAVALDIPISEIGLIGGAYTAAAAVSGVAGAFFLDRFDRRSALAVAIGGLVIGTAAGGFATGMYTLIAARLLAGMFGGPATSLALSIVTDVVPPERRGKALGTVMMSFSVASVLGVPAGLELATIGSWRTPFFAVAALGLVVASTGIFFLPPLRGHLSSGLAPQSFGGLLRKPLVLVSYTMTALVMMSGFLIIPSISPFVQENLGYPRERLSLLYLIGGLASLITVPTVGRLVDRFGSFRVGAVGALLLLIVTFDGFVDPTPLLPVLGIFVGFMFAMGIRNVAYNTLTTKVPAPNERASFMSIQSAVQHLSAAAGAVLATMLLTVNPDGTLDGMPKVAMGSIVLSALIPFLLHWVEKRVRAERPPKKLVLQDTHGSDEARIPSRSSP